MSFANGRMGSADGYMGFVDSWVMLWWVISLCYGGSSVCAMAFVGQWWISPEFFFCGCVLIFLAKLA